MGVNRIAKMWQVNPAKRTMPVRTVTLTLVQMITCNIDGLLVTALGFGLFEQPADVHHPRVHVVGFGILDFKITPKPTAHERLNLFPF